MGLIQPARNGLFGPSQPSRGLLRAVGCEPDGTGTDAAWKGFVSAIVNHVCPTSTSCKIQNWEGWNEPNNPGFWQSTTAQMVRMQQDAYNIIKGINSNLTVVSPSVAPGGGDIENGITWITGFLNAGGKGYEDVMGFHGYLGAGQPPEGIATLVHDWSTLLSSQGLSSVPLWDTEGSWGLNTNLTDPDEQVAFLGRYYLLQSAGVARFYWYSYDSNYGRLESNNVLDQSGRGLRFCVPVADRRNGYRAHAQTPVDPCGRAPTAGREDIKPWLSGIHRRPAAMGSAARRATRRPGIHAISRLGRQRYGDCGERSD